MEKKSKVIILVLFILIVLGFATQLFLTPSTVSNAGGRNITDMINRTVEVPVDISSVVATSPPMTTIVYMIAPDELAAVNFQWNDYELEYVPPQYQNLPVVGGWYGSQDGSYEEFIALEPDIVIESIDENGDEDLSTVEERQAKFGDIPVVAVRDVSNLERINESILFIGQLIGASDTAQNLVDFNNRYLDEVHRKAPNITQPRTVYYAKGSDGLETVPSGSSHSQLIDLVGGINVVDSLGQDNLSSNVQVSMEQIISWNPDVIIATDPEFYSNVYNDSDWAQISAVQNHEVYLAPQSPFKWFDKPGGANLIIGLPWVAKVIYPDVYSDIDMVNATMEFYSEFYHYDLSQEQAREILLNSGLDESDL